MVLDAHGRQHITIWAGDHRPASATTASATTFPAIREQESAPQSAGAGAEDGQGRIRPAAAGSRGGSGPAPQAAPARNQGAPRSGENSAAFSRLSFPSSASAGRSPLRGMFGPSPEYVPLASPHADA